MKKLTFFTLIFLFFVFLHSCDNNKLKVDVSDIEVPVFSIKRLDRDIFAIDTNNMDEANKILNQKYGNAYNLFVINVLNNGGHQGAPMSFLVKSFISDTTMREVYKECQQKFPDLSFLENELTDVFKHYSYHFPKRTLPTVIAMMSGFNYQNYQKDSIIFIGLETYLGKDCKYYPMLGLPGYKSAFMTKESMSTDLVRNWMHEEFPYNMNKNDFLSNIIYNGKLMYLNDALLPELNDTIKMKYTQKQLDYCTQNEFNIWTYFIAQNILYTTDYAEIMKFTAEGPFTSALSKESAPRIGYWTGLQIIKHYMKNNPDITLEQLMAETDAQVILSKSKYKPKK